MFLNLFLLIPVGIIVLVNFYYLWMLYIRSKNGHDWEVSQMASLYHVSNFKKFLATLNDEDKLKRYKRVLYT